MRTHLTSRVLKVPVLAGALLCLMGHAALSGQDRDQPTPREARASPEVRQACQQAAATLLAGPAAHEAEQRVLDLALCEVSAPPALAAAWTNPVVLSNAVNQLRGVSMRTHDLRILEAVLPIVQNQAEPMENRMHGITVLGAYLFPRLQTQPTSWWGSPDQEWPALVGSLMHATWSVGPEPIDDDARDRIVEALRGLLEPWDELDLAKVSAGVQPVQALTPVDEARLALVAYMILLRWEAAQMR